MKRHYCGGSLIENAIGGAQKLVIFGVEKMFRVQGVGKKCGRGASRSSDCIFNQKFFEVDIFSSNLKKDLEEIYALEDVLDALRRKKITQLFNLQLQKVLMECLF